MALKKYDVRVGSFSTVLLLNDADAKARGLGPEDLAGAAAAAEAEAGGAAAVKAAKVPANKARAAADK